MPNGNGKLLSRVVAVMSSLLVAGIIGGVVMYRSVGIAEENIKDIKERQKVQEQLIEKALGRIDEKLGDIAKAINQSNIEAAKHHHTHNPK